MIRFRNPSSSLETMLASFCQLYDQLNELDYFDNDDIAQVLAGANLMASSGFTGDAALTLGSNKDRSRDKTYNNAKMFAETFRLLGLISTVNEKSSNYRFTYIGEHLAVKDADQKSLIEQCILGMNNPNRIMDVSYNEMVRFFSCVLLAMDRLDGCICRDEMILGPMCVNDNQPDDFNRMIDYILKLRGNYKELQDSLLRLAKSLQGNKRGGMSVTSVQNCTRFPISVLKYCGWVESENLNIYRKSVRFMKLTEHGKETVYGLKQMRDIRLADYDNSNAEQKKALIRLGAYSMLGRANFDLSSVAARLDQDQKICDSILRGKSILFSPFQTLPYDVVNNALGITYEHNVINHHMKMAHHIQAEPLSPVGSGSNQTIRIQSDALYDSQYKTQNTEALTRHIFDVSTTVQGVSKIAEVIAKEHINDKKDEFYPLVETLFRIIGVNCYKSRDGVNGERWDAMIRDDENSIPIEIKSPTEEMHLSVKAIRQAVENKIILLSRKTYETTEECSTFAVGYYLPNDRAEVADLIENFKKAFGYSVAVFDIETLIRIAVNIVLNGKGIDVDCLKDLEGIVNVASIKS